MSNKSKKGMKPDKKNQSHKTVVDSQPYSVPEKYFDNWTDFVMEIVDKKRRSISEKG